MQYFPYVIVFVLFLFQIITLNRELFSPYFVNPKSPIKPSQWFIHHDEKIALADARYLYLKNFLSTSIWDFLPYPVSAAFGILYPYLIYFGFKLLGFNNYGLRFINLIICTVVNLLLVDILYHIGPAYIAFVMSCLLLINYNYFILTRHAIIENVLTFYAVALIYCFICLSEIFLNHGFVIGFLTASSVLVKINFPFYLFVLLCSVSLSISISLLGHVVGGFVVGFIVFLLINLKVLEKYQCSKWFFSNLLIVLKVHSGKQANRDFVFKPLGVKIFQGVLQELLRWFLITVNGQAQPSSRVLFFKQSLYASVFIFGLFLTYKFNSQFIWIWVFIVLYHLCLMPLYFYIKRFVFFLPFFIVGLVCSLNGLFIILPYVQVYVNIFITVVVIFICFKQIKFGYMMFKQSTNNPEVFSKEIDSLFDSPQDIYCHCYALRFLWMIKRHRLISGDDNILYNEEIVDMAIKNQAKYVIVCFRGDFNYFKFTRCAPLCFLTPIKMFTTCESDSDTFINLILCKIDL